MKGVGLHYIVVAFIRCQRTPSLLSNLFEIGYEKQLPFIFAGTTKTAN